MKQIVYWCWLLLAVQVLPAASAADCLVVCPDQFRTAIKPWVDYRQRQGISVRLVDSAADAATVKRSLLAASLSERTQFVVLVGDCRLTAAEQADPSLEVPTFYRATGPAAKYGSTATLPSDASYTDLNGDGVPQVAVGRMPVDTADQLTNWIDRIIAYETSENFDRWRDRVQITAGIGGFGMLADAAIESATRSVLTSTLPDAVSLAVTYASPRSPFNPGAIDFFPATLRRYREGGAFWVYMGHGNITALDRVPGPNGTRRPVLTCEDLDLLEVAPGSAPIGLLLACYTGAFDASVDCLAEQMVQCPGGPIAVLASSRVSMPYGNALIAQGLIHACYQQRVERLGTAWLIAQQEVAEDGRQNAELAQRRRLVDLLATALSPDAEQLPAERVEHIHLYNLLGDPTLRLQHPQAIVLDVPSGLSRGEKLVVRGVAPHGGKLTVSLCHFPGSVPTSPGLSPSERYEQANCVDVLQTEIEDHAGGNFELALVPPAGLSGRFRVVARVQGTGGWSTGAATLLLRP